MGSDQSKQPNPRTSSNLVLPDENMQEFINKNLQDQINIQRAQLGTIVNSCEHYRELLATQKNQSLKLGIENHRLQRDIESNKDSLSSVKRDLEQKSTELTLVSSELQKNKSETSNLVNLQWRVTSERRSLNELLEKKSKLVTELSDIRCDIDKETEFLKNVKRDINNSHTNLSTTKNAITEKGDELSKLRNEKEQEEYYCQHLRSTIEKLKVEHKRLDSMIMSSNNKLQARDARGPDKLTAFLEDVKGHRFKYLVDCDTEWEWSFVENEFNSALYGGRLSIDSIKKVSNPTLEADYLVKKFQMVIKHGDGNVREVLLYRAVAAKNIDKVAEKGYNYEIKGSGGAAFFNSVKKCNYYFKSGHDRQIYLVKVLTTRENNVECCKAEQTSKKNETNQKIVINEENTMCPLYLISYSGR